MTATAPATAPLMPNITLENSLLASLGGDKYRGANVEDLQLPPAFSLPHNERIMKAIELAYDRDFSHIPILSDQRKPLGYIDVAALKKKWEAGQANPTDSVLAFATKFKTGASHPYTVVSPSTSLTDLETFLQDKIFAIVTDQDRKFVLGVATQQDLESFVSRRGF